MAAGSQNMMDTGVITGVSVAHERASVPEIESVGVDDERAVVGGLLARDGVEEAFALGTCNRAEAYVVTDNPARGREVLSALLPDMRDGAIRRMDHEESLKHLMRVAAGLESLVIGEDQILGQMKEAVATARAAGGVGELLDEALTKAVHVGERAREETKINEGATSLGSAAVELAEREADGLEGTTAVVVGAGEMGALAARTLDAAGVERIAVANRTVPHAEHVAADLEADADALPLERMEDAFESAEVIITATDAPGPIVDPDVFTEADDQIVIDIAQPRDVPASAAEHEVELYDLDALKSVTSATRANRAEAAETVETMIEAEFERLLKAFKRKQADTAISAMYEAAERTKRRELEKAMTKLEAQDELTSEQRETIEALADALVGQLLAAPTKSLREAAAEDDWTTIQTAMQLFDPEFDAPPEVPPQAGRPESIPEDIPDDVPDAVRDRLLDR